MSKRENTFGYQLYLGALGFNTRFKMGSVIYTYVGKTIDPREEECSFLDGTKTMTLVHREVYVLKNEKGQYKAFHETEIRDKRVRIIS